MFQCTYCGKSAKVTMDRDELFFQHDSVQCGVILPDTSLVKLSVINSNVYKLKQMHEIEFEKHVNDI